MAKVSKPQSNRAKKNAEPKKPVEKSNKIAKAKQAPKAKARAADPKEKQPKQGRSAGGLPKFYTVGEDSQILDALRNVNENNNKSTIAKELSKTLGRTVESVRDRIKRYLSNLATGDAKEIQKVAKKSPGHFAHFVSENNSKRVDKIAEEEPSIYNRDQPAQSGQNKAKKPNQQRKIDFSWLQKKINAADPYFAIDHSVHLLNSLFAKLMEEGTERRELETFINGHEGEVTLFEILSNFVKKDQQKSKAK